MSLRPFVYAALAVPFAGFALAQDASDGARIAPGAYKTLYEDSHIRLVEFVLKPGQTIAAHTNPYPAVIAYDAARPALKETAADPASADNGQADTAIVSAAGMPYPVCKTAGVRAAYTLTNTDAFPLHAYRIEFKRVDGEGIKTNWKAWYPEMLKPIPPVKNLLPAAQKGAPFSKEWPFPIAFDSYKAAPNNHTMRYQDAHVRFLEVTIRPGERENVHGHPYPSVFAFDSAIAMQPPSADMQILSEPGLHLDAKGAPLNSKSDIALLPDSPLNQPVTAGSTGPNGGLYPRCQTMAPQAPHAAYNSGLSPLHFYRIEFTRVDGEAFKANWKTLYPRMAAGG